MTDRKTPTLKIAGVLQQNTFDAKRRVFSFQAPAGATEHDVKHPDFWRAIGGQLSRNDVIYLLAPDEAWEMELRVEKAGSECEVSITRRISRVPLGGAVENLNDTDYLQYRGPEGWCVMRRARTDRDEPKAIIKGMTTAGAARNRWFNEQPKKVA